ncbi:MAG TPA: anti-sigma factor [Solirubrobacteraceae bacterium]|nr:anti-sigma factor [Solirubrobacteraceae bacterium]
MSPQCPCREDTGAWVLGALPPDEARRFVVHLEACADCRDEVVHLQAGADVLPRAVYQVPAPPAVRDRVMAVVESEAALLAAASEPVDRTAPRKARWKDWAFGVRPAVAAAVACGLMALSIGAGVLAGDGEERREATASVAEALPSTEAVLRVEDGEATLRVDGLPAPEKDRDYQVWLKPPGEAPRPAGALFVPSSEGKATVEIPADVTEMEAVLVTNEPAGGSPAPTSDPIIAATPPSA